MYLSVYLAICRSIHPSIYLSIYVSIHVSACLSACLPACLSISLFVYLPFAYHVCVCVCMYIYIYMCVHILLFVFTYSYVIQLRLSKAPAWIRSLPRSVAPVAPASRGVRSLWSVLAVLCHKPYSPNFGAGLRVQDLIRVHSLIRFRVQGSAIRVPDCDGRFYGSECNLGSSLN